MRYALYFTPAQTDPLAVAAQTWLGRDAFTGQRVDQPAIAGVAADELDRLTADPRRYGFHATLVAPFRLRDDLTEDAIARATEEFAAVCVPFDIPRLTVTRIADFRVLRPADRCLPLEALAGYATDHFEDLRAPLTDAEIARRNPDRLTPRQRVYLDRYGYPYVKEEFRFHMTLTGALTPEEDARLLPALDAHFGAALRAPVAVDAVTLFVEPSPGADFTVHFTHRLGAAESRRTA